MADTNDEQLKWEWQGDTDKLTKERFEEILDTLSQTKKAGIYAAIGHSFAEYAFKYMMGKDLDEKTLAQMFVDGMTRDIDEVNRSIALTRHAAPDSAEPFIQAAGTREERAQLAAHAIYDDNTDAAISMWATLEPYIDANANFDDIDAVIAAAAEKARADGKEIPTLTAERLADSLMLLAEPRRAATMADKEVGFEYFTSRVIKYLPDIGQYILNADGSINLYDLTKGGKPVEEVLQEVDEMPTAFLMWLFACALLCDLRENTSRTAIIRIDVKRFFAESGLDARWDTTTKQMADTGIPLAELRRQRFLKDFLLPLDCFAGWFKGDLYRVAALHTYDTTNELCYITAPYMLRLAEYRIESSKNGVFDFLFYANTMNENQAAVEVASRIVMGIRLRGTTPGADFKRRPTKRTTKRTLSDGTKETQVEEFESPDTVTETIYDEVEGKTYTTKYHKQKEDKPVDYEVFFQTIIDDCPMIKKELDAIEHYIGEREQAAIKAGLSAEEVAAIRKDEHKHDRQRYNKKLKDTFEAAVRIIMKKSEVPQYYDRLTITTEPFDTFKAPTKSTLKRDILLARHYGKNKNFQTSL